MDLILDMWVLQMAYTAHKHRYGEADEKEVPYSAKFSRHLYFVDWPIKVISLHNVCGMTYRKPRL